MDSKAAADYQHCQRIARRHYENFPVASWLLPRELRGPVAAVYAFARRADDFADEGKLADAERLRQLDAMGKALHAVAAGSVPDDPVYRALADSAQHRQLPLDPLHDLLSAFRQDVTTLRYETGNQLLDYCRRSANPIGRVLLTLFKADSEDNLRCGDALCTALQLINFLQDLHQDITERDRIYIPREEMNHFNVTEAQLRDALDTPGLRRLLRFQTQRAARFLRVGTPLGARLPGRLGLELRMIIAGGESMLERLQARRNDPFQRPHLARRDRARMLWRAFTHQI